LIEHNVIARTAIVSRHERTASRCIPSALSFVVVCYALLVPLYRRGKFLKV